MFNTILGVPAHPLLIHAAVVFIPLLIVAAIAYAAFPGLRKRIDWAVVALAVVAPFAALFAKLSGQNLKTRLIDKHIATPTLLKNIAQHNGFGNNTFWWTLALGILTLVLFGYHWSRGRQVPVVDGDSMAIRVGTTAVMVIVGVVVGYYVFRTGDTGAHMVWQGY